MNLGLKSLGLFPKRAAVPAPELDAPDYPEGVPDTPALSAAPVHVLSGDARVRLNSGRLRVEYPDRDAVEVPVEQVSALHIHGWVHVTSATIAAMAAMGAPVLWRSPNGYPLAVSQSLSPAGTDIRRAQYKAAADPRTCLQFARPLVSAKIRNMRGLLRRRLPGQERPALAKLQSAAIKAEHARSAERLLGIEGNATALYFEKWPQLIRYRGQPGDFTGRSRRPPGDLANAALSYLYMVLLGECTCALTGAGLDVREGFLHRPRAGRPALALDFMEPFRPLIVDACVSAMLNRGQMTADEVNPGRLSDDNRRTLLQDYEARLASEIAGVFGDGRTSLRNGLHAQARDLARCLRSGAAFQPAERA